MLSFVSSARLQSWLLALCLVFTVACGSRTSLRGTDAGSCDFRFNQDAAFREYRCGNLCILSGTSVRGETLELRCDGRSCTKFVNNVQTCDCPTLEFNNTCSQGTPLCAERGDFNFARTTFEACVDP